MSSACAACAVFERDGKWWHWTGTLTEEGPFDTQAEAQASLDTFINSYGGCAVDETQVGWMEPLPGVTEPVELDPEAAEARLSTAAQVIVELALALIHNSKSDVFVRKEDVKALRAAASEFELAYAETVTIGKILGLAQSLEGQPALGDNKPAEVVDAGYDYNPNGGTE